MYTVPGGGGSGSEGCGVSEEEEEEVWCSRGLVVPPVEAGVVIRSWCGCSGVYISAGSVDILVLVGGSGGGPACPHMNHQQHRQPLSLSLCVCVSVCVRLGGWFGHSRWSRMLTCCGIGCLFALLSCCRAAPRLLNLGPCAAGGVPPADPMTPV